MRPYCTTGLGKNEGGTLEDESKQDSQRKVNAENVKNVKESTPHRKSPVC
jgi:hypothetical protein